MHSLFVVITQLDIQKTSNKINPIKSQARLRPALIKNAKYTDSVFTHYRFMFSLFIGFSLFNACIASIFLVTRFGA